jgi:ferredoxin-type protein NapH
MKNLKLLENSRKAKQLIMGSIFLFLLLGGWFNPLLGLVIPACMFLGIILGMMQGRKWCDWFCPRGSFYDAMVKPLSRQRTIPPIFKSFKFRVAVLAGLMLMMGLQVVRLMPNPFRIGSFFVIMLTVITILGVILGLIFHQRSWCSFCPVGTLANWTGGGKNQIRIKSGVCVECKLCYKICPMQIDPVKYKKNNLEPVTDGDCLKCGLCVAACPVKALNFSK